MRAYSDYFGISILHRYIVNTRGITKICVLSVLLDDLNNLCGNLVQRFAENLYYHALIPLRF